MRRSIYLVLGAVGLMAVCAGLVFLLVDVNQFRGTIQAQLERQLKRPVTLGDLRLGLFPLAIRVKDVVIGESPRFPTGRPFASAKSVQVRTGLLPLLRKELRIDSFVLQQPEIELVRNAGRQWNFSDLGGQSSEGGGGGQVTVSHFEIEDGTLAISDLGSEKSRALYEHVNIRLSDIEPGKPFRLQAGAQLPGSGNDSLRLEGTGGPLGGTGLPFNGRLSLKEAPVAGLAKVLGSTLPVDGLLTGTADLRSTASLATAAGRLELKNGSTRGKELGIPLTLDFDLSDDLPTGVLQARKLKLMAQNVAIEGTGEVNTKASTVNGRLRLADSSLRDVLVVARLLGAEEVSGSGRVSLDAAVQGPLSGALSYSGSGTLRDADITAAALAKPLRVKSAAMRFDKDTVIVHPVECSLAGSTLRGSLAVRDFASPDLSFDLDIDKIDAAQWQQLSAADSAGSEGKSKPLKLRAKGVVRIGSLTAEGLALTNVRSECLFDHGVLTLSPLTAQIFGGNETGSLMLDTRARPPALTTNLTFKDVDANSMLSATTSVRNVLYGLFGASGQARLNLANSTEMARSLNGDVRIGLVRGRLAGTNVLNQLASVSQFLGYSNSSQNFTNIVQLAGDLKVSNGLARTDNLQMQVEGAALAAVGTVNLVDQALNLKVTAVLDREMSQKVGGTKVGGYMQTALANNRGELVIPALVSGTLAQPRFAPDVARMAEMKLKNLLPSAANPGGLLGNLSGDPKNAGRSLLDALAGKPAAQPAKPDPAKPAAQQEKPDIFGTIDSLIRSKKKQ